MWNIEQEKDREKVKVGGRPAKLNKKKGDRASERWKTKETFLVGGQHGNFVAAMTKWEMLPATNQVQGENERQWKKENENTSHISSIKSVT